MSFKFSFIISLLLLFSCQNEGSDRSMEEIKDPTGTYSDLIRMPISSDGTIDTVNIAKFEFDEKIKTFDDINEGEKVEVVYKFRNVGKSPLLITSAQSTCGCTVPEFPKEPIAPGDSSSIKVKFDSENRPGFQTKPITILANTYPNKTQLTLEGQVNELPKN